jgi:PmbA protein
VLEGIIRAIDGFRGHGESIRAWSLYSAESRRFSLGTKDRQTGNAHAPLGLSESRTARYLLVWSDGLVSRGLWERRQLEVEPESALDQARLAAYDDPDAAWVLGPAPIPDVEIHDATVATIASGALDRVADRMGAVRSVVEERGFRTWSGSIGAGESDADLRTSEGLITAGSGTSFGWHVTFNGELGDGFGGRALDPEEDFLARLARLADTVEALGRDAPSVDPGVRDVVLHPNVVENFVLGTLLSNLDGSTVANGEGHFRREQFERGDLVARDDLTLRMDPLQPLRSGSYRYTAEGLPASPCAYVERGRLVTPILNLKYARRLEMAPTPGPAAMDGLVLEGPPVVAAPSPGAIEDGVLVLSVLGVHTQDPASGDFSLSSPQCLRLGPDGPVGRLRATISGNLWEILGADELRLVRFEGEHTPGLLVRCRLDT